MIPKEAFIAISLIMGVSCLFGYVLRGIVDKGRKSDSEWFYDGSEADHDRWERDPLPTQTCDNCRFKNVHWYEEPCLSCQADDYGSKWEADT